jgi:predicted lactoylglutathione lyase
MSLTKLIFLNLPVRDTAVSTAFYEAIGAEKNPMFSDETTSCMVLSDTIHVMLLNHDRFAGFTPGLTIADATSAAGMLIAISQDSAADVDALIARAVAAGGAADPTPKQVHGDFMYGRSFRSPDGHIWEAVWMDVAAAGAAQ